MNRLVLIGNGFDLAHGLKTQYKDFIYWYWKQRAMRFHKETGNVSNDGLSKLTILQDSSWPIFMFQNSFVLKEAEGKEIYEYLIENTDAFKVEHRYLFDRIHKSIETKGWVDIENDYYTLLYQRTLPLEDSSDIKVKYLNVQLDAIRNHLVSYLKLEDKKETQMIDSIREKIYAPIAQKDVAVTSGISFPNSLDQIMLLSFNYTSTPKLYVTDKATVNYIHGQLDTPQSIIFGYGDELDDGFKRLQEINDNECLRHIKSIRYLESDNYRKMLSFIESEPFQVVIMGHSCGNSDRTLLNTLFEHKNCVSIKPYYYKRDDGSNNYLELIQNISRNFTDMKLMRDRVVNKTFTEPLI